MMDDRNVSRAENLPHAVETSGSKAEAPVADPRRHGHSALGFALVALVVLFVLATRFWALGAKPFQHDEAMFASHAFNLRMTGDYNFDPILHGPFLEDVSALIFFVFGDSDVTARLWSAIAGTLLLLVVWRLRNQLGSLAARLAVVFLAVSPTLMYYSRFNRNDVPFTLAAMVFVACMIRFLQHGRLRYWLLALLAVAWMICIEETYVIFLFIAATYPLGVALVESAAGRPSSVREKLSQLTRARPHFWPEFGFVTALGSAVAAAIIVTLYTTFLRHPEHAAGPIEALRYWAGQHKEQRIFGEFHYYLPILIIYEFFFLALFVWGIARTLRRLAASSAERAEWLRRWIAWGWVAWSAALLVVLWPYTFPRPFASLIHMTQGWHLWLAVQVFALGAAACAVLALERRWLQGFFLWWSVVAFLAYSYAGEKVPWITVHVVFPMIVTAAIFAQEIISTKAGCQPAPLRRALGLAFWVTGFVATVAIALRLSFTNNANPAERHVYTHTTADYKAMIAEVQDIVARADGRPIDGFPLTLTGDSLWPGQWYFRRWQMMRAGPLAPKSPIIILDEYLDPLHRDVPALSKCPWLLDDYVVRRVPFREWWHQEPLMATFGRLFDIWMALVPKQYRRGLVTDAQGRPVGLFGDRGRLPGMTIEDEIAAGKAAWRDIYDYLVYRWDFDPYRSPYRTRDCMSVLLCVQKDLYKKWLHLGGRHLPARTRFVRHLAGTKSKQK
jgi:uncharacterized protein (TIGR03663 family)